MLFSITSNGKDSRKKKVPRELFKEKKVHQYDTAIFIKLV